MKAMILAAGKSTRMAHLTQNIPKPLLKVHGIPLVEYHLNALAAAGFTEVVINVSKFAERFISELGHGSEFGLKILYSFEDEPLETGGGIYNALPYLGLEPFVVISCDIWTDYDFKKLPLDLGDNLAHLVLVDNPSHHPEGDFALNGTSVTLEPNSRLNYGGISVCSPFLFVDPPGDHFPLRQALVPAIEQGLVSGEHFQGRWVNVDTPERLEMVNQTPLHK